MIYFNEIDPFAAHVLKTCYSGYVDDRSILDVKPEELAGYNRAHFFGGAGLWQVACELAGWPDDRAIWTASCPCQPFSVAGKGLGVDDPRRLWPHLFRLVRACRPPTIVGEQVAGAAGYGWLDGVRADLESEGYACRAVDIPACAINAPHERSRLYWVAVANTASQKRISDSHGDGSRKLGFADENGLEPMADAVGEGRERLWRRDVRETGREDQAGSNANADAGHWADYEWLQCDDGKARRTKPSLRMLVNGMAGRTDLWRLACNSIVPQLAAEVLKSLMETT